jgi:hypothetical protein
MNNLKTIKFQYYDGDIERPVPIGYITLKQFIERHKNPTQQTVEAIEKIAWAGTIGDKKLKNELKQTQLYYFTVGAIFKDRFHRRYENIVSFTGLAQIDIDGLKQDEAVDLKQYLFDTYKQLHCVYTSPSRRGVKALMRIPIVNSVKEFKEYYQAIQNEFEWIAGFDPAPKNLALPLFLSYDVDILWRQDAECWTSKAELQADELPNLNDTPLSKSVSKLLPKGDAEVYRSQPYFQRITLDLFQKKLDAIVDNGHPQLRSACLVLGSRVGAGYLSQSDAETYAEWLIKSNHYLQKGIAGYIDTMRWAIKNGIKNPKYYD